MLPYIMGNLVRYVVPPVEHGKQDSLYKEVRIQVLLYEINCPKQLAQTFHGIKFTLERYQDRIRRRKGVDRQQPERRRSIEDDIIIIVDNIPNGIFQLAFPRQGADKFYFSPRKVRCRGRNIEISQLCFMEDVP